MYSSVPPEANSSVILQVFGTWLEQILPSGVAYSVRADSSPQKSSLPLWLIAVKEAKLEIVLGIFSFYYLAAEKMFTSTKLGYSL